MSRWVCGGKSGAQTLAPVSALAEFASPDKLESRQHVKWRAHFQFTVAPFPLSPELLVSASPRQIVQSLYDAFAVGDAVAVLGGFDPDIVWNEAENIPYADRNPYIGPQQVAEGVFGRIMTEWDGFTVNPERLIEEGNTVVAVGRYRGVFKATGQRLDAQFAHVWTLAGGKVVQFQQYSDTAQYVRVSGAMSSMSPQSA